MKVQRTVTIPDTDGKPGITMTLDEDVGVKVSYEGIRFIPPTVSLHDLTEAVAALNSNES